MIADYPVVMQGHDYDCGSAALDGVFRHFGVRTRATLLRLVNDQDGLHPATLEALLRQTGLKVQSGQMTLDDLRHHTKSGRPVLCPIDLFGGHWVTVVGTARGKVHYVCPVGGELKSSYGWWASKWCDSTRAGHTFDHWGIAVGTN